MKPLTLFILCLFIAFGSYLNSFDGDNPDAMIQDSVGSRFSAPVK